MLITFTLLQAIKVGKDVKTIKVGDRVGVGAQVQADLTCNNCRFTWHLCWGGIILTTAMTRQGGPGKLLPEHVSCSISSPLKTYLILAAG